jgi:ribosomal protein S18 acetylase RimI-like enzyme
VPEPPRPIPGDPEAEPLGPSRAGRAAITIARAFAWHEPWGAWALPDPRTREGTLARLVEADIIDRFLPFGEGSTIAGLSVALWVPPPSHPGAREFGGRRGEAEYAAYGPQEGAMRAGDELLERLRPEGEHWYLDTIATDPDWMRRGLAGRLLDHDLAGRDARGESSALDTHTVKNVGFYESRGFELVAHATLPAGGPDLFVMLRPPRG